MSGLPILIVDDVPMQRELLSIQLRGLGLQSHAVDNGAAALEALAHARYALVLMDCRMPVMDGPQACRLLRTRELASGAARTPVLGLSASIDPSEQALCLAAGMDACLFKPLARALLRAELERWLVLPLSTPF